jgi:hypothetical protein
MVPIAIESALLYFVLNTGFNLSSFNMGNINQSLIVAGSVGGLLTQLGFNIYNTFKPEATIEETIPDIISYYIYQTIIETQYSNFSSIKDSGDFISADELFENNITTLIKSLFFIILNLESPGNFGNDQLTSITTSNVKNYEKYQIKIYDKLQTQDIPKIKSKMININIPMQSYYYALMTVKSTYNKVTGERLKQYNKDKDKVLQEIKKEKSR